MPMEKREVSPSGLVADNVAGEMGQLDLFRFAKDSRAFEDVA